MEILVVIRLLNLGLKWRIFLIVLGVLLDCVVVFWCMVLFVMIRILNSKLELVRRCFVMELFFFV